MQNLILELLNEKALTSKERKSIKSEQFGLPDLRKFPIHDKMHVVKAIQYFHKCPKNRRKELAIAIRNKAIEYNVHIGEDSLIKKYI